MKYTARLLSREIKMSEEIGQLWESGERLFRSGDTLEALLSFQRAKALLILESKSVYANSSMYEMCSI